MLEGMSRGGRPQGSMRALSADEERRAQKLICARRPDQLSLPFALWTRSTIRDLIWREFNVRLSIRGVGECLTRWGYIPHRAARRAYERYAKDWLSIVYPKIKERAKQVNAEISWYDETWLGSDETTHRGYAPAIQTPIIKISARRRSLSIIAAETNQGKVKFMIYPDGLSPERLIVFMQQSVKDAPRNVFLILDHQIVYRTKLVREWLCEHADEIEGFCLPPYTPEWNPSKHVNRNTLKSEIQRGVPRKDVTGVKQTMLSAMRRIRKSPSRVRTYLKLPDIKYAA